MMLQYGKSVGGIGGSFTECERFALVFLLTPGAILSESKTFTSLVRLCGV